MDSREELRAARAEQAHFDRQLAMRRARILKEIEAGTIPLNQGLGRSDTNSLSQLQFYAEDAKQAEIDEMRRLMRRGGRGRILI